MRDRMRYAPAAVLALGCLLLLSVQAQRTMALQAPLAQLPDPLPGYTRTDLTVPAEEARVAGMSSYTNRLYLRDSVEAFSLYVGFYENQQQGRTVHSPKNCLPGAGWEPMAAERVAVGLPGEDSVQVNRYLIGNQLGQRALVYYWYQGRGRVAANEYAVKWNLLRDAALRRRTDEALVRLVFPVTADRPLAQADSMALTAIRSLVPTLRRYLPS
ncbi:MAG TPA: EpsI family protein [Gemmatimonadaceae bacterium]|nr:EpsI family protein [Gemmatimonadaceae bacterium]